MAIIHNGSGKIEGINYFWSLKDTDDNGSRVEVTIAKWDMSRPFPTVLSLADATKVAEALASSLFATIQGSH